MNLKRLVLSFLSLNMMFATIGCGESSPSKALVGKWVVSDCPDERESEGDVVEFLIDGTFIAEGEAARYSVIEGGRLKIESVEGATVVDYSLSGDTLRITSDGDTCAMKKASEPRPAPDRKPGGQDQLLVPLLIGQDEAAARKVLDDGGLKVQTKDVAGEANPVGRVVDQEPKAGSRIERGATVTISVSSGAPIIGVPDVRNRTVDAATELLMTAGFRVVLNSVSSDKAPNTVIEQSPAAGSRAAKGSNVTLTVSKGVDKIAVPNVRGRTAGDAANLLGQAGFRTTSRNESNSDFDPGEVIRTEPAAGTPLDRNSVVTLIVSR